MAPVMPPDPSLVRLVTRQPADLGAGLFCCGVHQAEVRIVKLLIAVGHAVQRFDLG